MNRQERWILSLTFGGLILIAAAMRVGLRWPVAIGSVLAGIGGHLSMLDSMRKGVIVTNLGVIRRTDCRSCFRLELAFWWILIALWTLGFVLYACGVIPHR